MEKKSKLILSIVGLGAIIVPALLLIFFTSKVKNEPQSQGKRQIDSQIINDAAKKLPVPNLPQPSPSSATASAKPSQGSSPSSR